MQSISPRNSAIDYRIMLGELQLSFVCLLMAQNFSGFNQWKKLVHLLCSCSELMSEKPDLFIEFMGKMMPFKNGESFSNSSKFRRCAAVSVG